MGKEKALKFSSKLQSNSAEVGENSRANIFQKKSLDHIDPRDSVFQHGLDSVGTNSHVSTIDSSKQEKVGRILSDRKSTQIIRIGQFLTIKSPQIHIFPMAPLHWRETQKRGLKYFTNASIPFIIQNPGIFSTKSFII